MEMKKLWDKQVCAVPVPQSWSKADHCRKSEIATNPGWLLECSFQAASAQISALINSSHLDPCCLWPSLPGACRLDFPHSRAQSQRVLPDPQYKSSLVMQQ